MAAAAPPAAAGTPPDAPALLPPAAAAAAAGAGAGAVSPSALPEGVDLRAPFPRVEELRTFVRAQLDLMRSDHLRPLNPTPYKVSVSPELFHFCHDLWMKEVPIAELE